MDIEEKMSEYTPSPPVKEGDTFKVKIEAIGSKGDGITKFAGYTVFVPGTKPDQEVNIKIIKVLPNVAFAEVID